MSNSTNTYTCKFCSKSFKTAHNHHCHEWRCPSNPERKDPVLTEDGRKRKSELAKQQRSKDTQHVCQYCGKSGFKLFACHEAKCHSNPNRKDGCKLEHFKAYYTKGAKIKDDVLNVSRFQIDQYIEQHPYCEICGKSANDETLHTTVGKLIIKRLSADHDHDTKQFRGVLCASCNIKLGWYERYKNEIEHYLAKDFDTLTDDAKQEYFKMFGKILQYKENFEIKEGLSGYVCSLCGQKFNNARSLRAHMGLCKKSISRTRLRGHNKADKSNTSYYTRQYNNGMLNVSQFEIDHYRLSHPICEICGNVNSYVDSNTGETVTVNLCIDHDHESKKFRGVLCTRCNSYLGWLQNPDNKVDQYCNRDLNLLEQTGKEKYHTLFGINLEIKQ